jgi:hypothetical protein
MSRRGHQSLLGLVLAVAIIARVLARVLALGFVLAVLLLLLTGCTLGRDSGVSRERELVAAQALAEIQQSAEAMQDEQLPEEARRAIPRAQQHWAAAGLRALHAEVDDGPR